MFISLFLKLDLKENSVSIIHQNLINRKENEYQIMYG